MAILCHWFDSTSEKSLRKRDSNSGSSALEADALTTRLTRRSLRRQKFNKNDRQKGKESPQHSPHSLSACFSSVSVWRNLKISHAIQWLASQRDARITHAIILTDSMNLLQKVESGMGCPDWHTAMHSLRLQRLLWIYCPGHAGVSGNERADRLASTADITSGLQLGRAEVLRGLRNFLSTDKPEHHSIDRLKERGVEKGSSRHSTLQGRERSVFNQTNIGTVSRATLGRLLRDGAERVWAFPSATMPS